MSQVLLRRKRKHIAERGTARKRGAGFDPGLRRLESEARESPVWGWQAKIPKVLRLPPPAADSSCALWVIHRMRYLPFQKMGRESSFYVNIVPKSFFFLEFLERLLDSSKYSFKSHWSICYSATVIAAGGGRFLTRCTHARTHTEARDCHLPMSRPGGSSCLEPVPYNLKLRFMTNFTKSLKDDAPSLTGLLSLKFNDPVRTVNWDEAVYFFIPNHYFTDTRLRTWFVHEIRLSLTL